MPRSRPNSPTRLTAATLRRWPLPVAIGGDKEERGRVLVVGGAGSMPGAAILTATAALRAGAGKLRIATAKSAREVIGLAMPEACVLALPESRDGAITTRAIGEIAEEANHVDAFVIGPGMVGDIDALMLRLVRKLTRPSVLLDAAAMAFLRERPGALHALEGRVVLTPHAGEFAKLRHLTKEIVLADPLPHARDAARELRAIVVLKGANTILAAPDGSAYENRYGSIGLGTSGSGDVLAGAIAGLLARGADPLRAAAWGVHLHARAGEVLAARLGGKHAVGFLARELPAEIPALMQRLS